MVSFGITHKGCVRATNQDTFATCDLKNTSVLIVCDGMGGANAGNVASRFAKDSILEITKEQVHEDMTANERKQVLKDAIEFANETVFHLSTIQAEFRGMGTTAVVAIVNGNEMSIANVGDSRAYRIEEKGDAIRLTQDHSYVEEMIRRGKLTESQAKNHPNRNLITRAVGAELYVEPDITEIIVNDNDCILLCSDGLSGMVSDSEISKIVQSNTDLEKASKELVDKALEAGGIDNVTVVLFKIANNVGKE